MFTVGLAQSGSMFAMTAILSMHHFGDRETWLLAGWDDVGSGGAGAGNVTDAYARGSSGMQSHEGAEASSTIPNYGDK